MSTSSLSCPERTTIPGPSATIIPLPAQMTAGIPHFGKEPALVRPPCRREDSLIMSGSQGLQGFCFPYSLPRLFLPMPSIHNSLGVAQPGLWDSRPWKVTVKCYSPAQPSSVSLCNPLQPPVSTAVLEHQVMPISPRLYPN